MDLQAAEWRIPAERMKAGREHRVPLSPAAMDTLERARKPAQSCRLVLPGSGGGSRQMHATTLAHAAVGLHRQLRLLHVDNPGYEPVKRLRRLYGDRCTVHGFRSSFRDWGERADQRAACGRRGGAGAPGGQRRRALVRPSDLFDKRRGLMNRWAEFVTSWDRRGAWRRRRRSASPGPFSPGARTGLDVVLHLVLVPAGRLGPDPDRLREDLSLLQRVDRRPRQPRRLLDVLQPQNPPSVIVGDPPALPGRHPEFDSTGSRMGKLPRVSRSSITQGSPHDELSQSKPHEMGVPVPRGIHPEVPEESDLRRAAPGTSGRCSDAWLSNGRARWKKAICWRITST